MEETIRITLNKEEAGLLGANLTLAIVHLHRRDVPESIIQPLEQLQEKLAEEILELNRRNREEVR